jgi:phenylacetic acid degradation protein/carnitine operon protein CaiE
MFPGTTVHLKKGAHVGHGAIIHGGILEENCLIGMNAVVMDDVVVGKESIIGALCFVPANMQIPERSLVVGNPAKIVKQVSDEMIAWKTEGTKLYQKLPKDCHTSLLPCDPLTEIEENRPEQEKNYLKWKK